MKYKIIRNPMSNDTMILRVEDQAYIPRDPANRDYQAFLEWEAEGNVADDPDPRQE